MSEHDQSADSPRPTTPPIGKAVERQGYRPLDEGYQPMPRKDSSSSNPPGDPPKQGPVGRKT